MRGQSGANGLADFGAGIGRLARNVDQDPARFRVTSGDGEEQLGVIGAAIAGDDRGHLQRFAEFLRNSASGLGYLVN